MFPLVLAWIVRTIVIWDHDYGGGTMNVLIIGVILGLLIWGLVSQNGVMRIIARIITGSLTLLSLAGMIFLFGVGQKAHWTSDGPGMLFIMIGVVACGFFAFLFGNLTLLTSPPQDTTSSLSLSELIRPSSPKEKGRPSA
jgi:hypothetical protein